ncbi:MAG: hypothetical protein IJE72_02630 [Clostridia bacterium]|nr:hypothetical protein [Clostridia bacterium]MBQ4602981.1 hypothetical protein [Clostridia bacterium]
MTKLKIFFLFLIPIVILLLAVLFFQLQTGSVSAYFKDVSFDIYVPRGIADKYTDLLTFSIDEHKIWEYKLNSDESREIQKDLDNKIWNKLSDEAITEIQYFFTLNSDSYLPDNVSDSLHYCIYDFSLKRFIGIEENAAILGWHRALFVYDKENSRYYCVSMSV